MFACQVHCTIIVIYINAKINATAFKLGMTVDLGLAYNMLKSMTLTLMQGHSGLAEGKIQRLIISTKQLISMLG